MLWRSGHVFALVAEDLEGFVEDRSQLGEDRATANATAFVMLNLRLGDAHPVHFPIDVLPTQRQRFNSEIGPWRKVYNKKWFRLIPLF
jgi:hypothetical protein